MMADRIIYQQQNIVMAQATCLDPTSYAFACYRELGNGLRYYLDLVESTDIKLAYQLVYSMFRATINQTAEL